MGGWVGAAHKLVWWQEPSSKRECLDDVRKDRSACWCVCVFASVGGRECVECAERLSPPLPSPPSPRETAGRADAYGAQLSRAHPADYSHPQIINRGRRSRRSLVRLFCPFKAAGSPVEMFHQQNLTQVQQQEVVTENRFHNTHLGLT